MCEHISPCGISTIMGLNHKILEHLVFTLHTHSIGITSTTGTSDKQHHSFALSYLFGLSCNSAYSEFTKHQGHAFTTIKGIDIL